MKDDMLGLGKVLPIDKLIDVVSSGVGRLSKSYFDKKDIDTKAYEIKKLGEATAHAKAHELKVISEAIRENQQNTGGIEYKATEFSIASSKDGLETSIINLPAPDLAERTQNRIDFKEAKRQQNLESIIANATEDLKEEPPVTDEPVDDDWKTRFFNYAEDVSNEEMQFLWGKILAGEIKKPKSYSLRALELLRNLSKEDAECFMKYAQFALRPKHGAPFILNFQDEKLLEEKYNLNFSDRLLLSELGLLASNDLAFQILKTEEMESKNSVESGKILILLTRKPHTPVQSVPVLVFTKIGEELLNLIDIKPNLDYIMLFASKFRSTQVTLKYGKIIEKVGSAFKTSGLLNIPITEEDITDQDRNLFR